ncbi:hypothetical protein [Rhizocola hellebori]|nr:hypothetical protein [Rhizocola hellebori]
MFWALVSYLVTTVGTMLANYLTPAEVTPLQGSLISTGVGLVVVMAGVFIDRAKSGRPQELPPPAPVYPGYSVPRSSPRPRTMPWVLAIVVVLLLCGCGGVGVTYAAQWIGGKIVTDVECMQHPDRCVEKGPSVSRLAQPVSKSAGYVTVTITKLAVAEKNVLVTITVKNGGPREIVMPSIQLTIPGARTLQRDSLAGDWSEGSVPANGERTGLLFFDGVIAGDVTKVTLAFTQIFSGDFNAPRNIAVDLPLITTS